MSQPSKSIATSPGTALEFKSYDEDQAYLASENPEPHSRSSTVIYYDYNRSATSPRTSKWWVKVTFRGYVYGQKVPIHQRQRELENFVQCIDFSSIPLLDDTVTEVLLDDPSTTSLSEKTEAEERVTVTGAVLKMHAGHKLNPNNPFAPVAASLRYTTREDPARVIYPSLDEFASFQRIRSEILVDRTEINDHVFRVRHGPRNKPYILKTVNRAFYKTHDTEAMRNELGTLARFRNAPNLVQAAGVVVSQNPYQTLRTADQPTQDVIIGVLLEFYPGGSLRTIIQQDPGLNGYPWQRWALQVTTALHGIHLAGKTHMDIKTANVFLDADGDAVLIGIGGNGWVTPGWTAPELRDTISGGWDHLPFEARRLNDSWALGKLLLQITGYVDNCDAEKVVSDVGRALMGDSVYWARMSLPDAIKKLEAAGIGKQ
ncbi:uncharacterized protein DSM5745_08408 [Aspergillus mulundensis]|uniref:Protein kinase domain-containing protein n=1 Tax=Aspergillus mulundensis TaxID=1810919 RepID=A0A3D8RA23_9EURO|nr:hypothetical protein DSM5745_08408 [Aspergillus mulundensis]RDW70897.1 hypothetical protein DSM5745_08408 [Aspergillus mulundensis]